MKNIDAEINALISTFLRQCGADPVTSRELMAVAGAQAEAELRTAQAHAESLGDETMNFSALEERKHAATLRGRELAALAILATTAPAGNA